MAASPGANIYDPTSSTPFGFAEIKCPFKYRELTPAQAAANSDFILRREPDGRLCLQDKHVYTSQIQGQMAIGGAISSCIQVILPEAVVCCLQTCNRCFVMRAIWCTSVPSWQKS